MKNLVRVLFLLLLVTPAYALQGTAGVTTSNGSASVNVHSTGGLANNTGTGSKQLSLIRTCADNELLKYTTAGGWACAADSTGGTPAFNAITSGTNTTAAMVVDSGASIDWSGTGKITANLIEFNPSSQTVTSNGYQITSSGVSHVCLDSTANRDLSGNPQILDGSNGQLLVVQNCDTGSETIKINEGNGLQLANNQSVILRPGEAIALMYVTTGPPGGASDWFEVSRTETGGDVIKARNYLACDGVTDDRVALNALTNVGGIAAGKTLDMEGCLALISNPGASPSTAVLVAQDTTIKCDNNITSGFKLAGKVCVGGNSAGAGCNTTADCATGATSCTAEGGGTEFATSGSGTYTVFGTPTSQPSAWRQKIIGCAMQSNQVPRYGTCQTVNAGEACRSVCRNAAVPVIDNYTCDAAGDCGGAGCDNDTGNCATNCTGEGVWPAGTGKINWVDFKNASVVKDNVIYDLAKSGTVISTAAYGSIQNNIMGSMENGVYSGASVVSPPITSYLGNAGSAFSSATMAIDTSIVAGVGSRVEYNVGITGTVYGINANVGSFVSNNILFEGNGTNTISINATSDAVVSSNYIKTNTSSGAVGVYTGANSSVDSNWISTTGTTATGVSVGQLSSVHGNFIVNNNTDSIGITTRGTNTQVVGNYIYSVNGGTDGGIQGGGVLTQGANSIVSSNNINVDKGSYGVDAAGTTIVVGNNITGATTAAYGDGIKMSGQQVTMTGNWISKMGMCFRPSGDAGEFGAINYLFVSNRCMQPNVSCGTMITGSHFSNNYCAWQSQGANLWIGDSGNTKNELCTSANTPFDCCNGSDQGNCDGTAQGTTPSTLTTGYGATTSHTNVVGNLFWINADNVSLLKFSAVGRRCACTTGGTALNGCTGTAGTSAWGSGCPCTQDSDCQTTGCTGGTRSCSATTTNSGIVITDNVFLNNGASSTSIDLLMDDDDFGESTSENTYSPSTTSLVSGVNVSGNTFSHNNTGSTTVNISSNSTVQSNITDMGFLANAWSGGITSTNRFVNWKWSMGVKDDNPVAILLGSTGAAIATATNSTNYLNPIGANSGTSEGNVDQTLPAGTLFRYKCRVSTAPSSTATRPIALRKDGADVAGTACTIASGANTCNMGSAEITYGEGSRMAYRIGLAYSTTLVATDAYCSGLYEITQSDMGWQW